MIGSNPVADLMDLGGLHSDPHVRYPVFSLLGINAPTHAIGRVLVEVLAPPRRLGNSAHHEGDRAKPGSPGGEDGGASPSSVKIQPAGWTAETRERNPAMAGGGR